MFSPYAKSRYSHNVSHISNGLTDKLYLSEVVEQKEEKKIINKKMEALVSTLASHSTLSPGSVRTLIKRTMDTEVNIKISYSPVGVMRC